MDPQDCRDPSMVFCPCGRLARILPPTDRFYGNTASNLTVNGQTVKCRRCEAVKGPESEQ